MRARCRWCRSKAPAAWRFPLPSSRSRIVVFHALGGRIEAGYFAIVSQGFPQLVRVSSDVVRPDHSRSFPERMPVLCQVRMLNETPLVPDLERLEVDDRRGDLGHAGARAG